LPLDILDQPKGGIAEATSEYLLDVGEVAEETLLDRLSYSEDGREFLERNVIPLLTSTGLVKNKKGALEPNFKILGGDSQRLKGYSFGELFRTELLSAVITCKEPRINYFRYVLEELFDVVKFDEASLEGTLRSSREKAGIEVSRAEELGGKTPYCIDFLKYFGIASRLGSGYLVIPPTTLVALPFSLERQRSDKASVKLFGELFDAVDSRYMPVLNKSENRVLARVHDAFSRDDLGKKLKFSYADDGGRTIMIGNKEYNVSLKGP